MASPDIILEGDSSKLCLESVLKRGRLCTRAFCQPTRARQIRGDTEAGDYAIPQLASPLSMAGIKEVLYASNHI